MYDSDMNKIIVKNRIANRNRDVRYVPSTTL